MKEPKVRLLAEKLNYILEKTHKEIEGKSNTNGAASRSINNEKVEKVNAYV